jgi:hypothetical protein
LVQSKVLLLLFIVIFLTGDTYAPSTPLQRTAKKTNTESELRVLQYAEQVAKTIKEEGWKPMPPTVPVEMKKELEIVRQSTMPLLLTERDHGSSWKKQFIAIRDGVFIVMNEKKVREAHNTTVTQTNKKRKSRNSPSSLSLSFFLSFFSIHLLLGIGIEGTHSLTILSSSHQDS